MWGALADERTGLSFTVAAGPRQNGHSRVRVPWDLQPYFSASDSIQTSLFVVSYDSQGYDGGILPRLHRLGPQYNYNHMITLHQALSVGDNRKNI
jgi:hypothetical protein